MTINLISDYLKNLSVSFLGNAFLLISKFSTPSFRTPISPHITINYLIVTNYHQLVFHIYRIILQHI